MRMMRNIMGMRNSSQSTLALLNEAIWYGKGGVAPGTDNNVADKVEALSAAEYVENSCGYFDGSSYAIASDNMQYVPDALTFERFIWCNITATGSNQAISGKGFLAGLPAGSLGGFGIYVRDSTGKFEAQIRSRASGSDTATYAISTITADGQDHFIRYGYDGTRAWIKVDNEVVQYSSNIAITSFNNSAKFTLGARDPMTGGTPGLNSTGKIWGYGRTIDGDDTVVLPIAEGYGNLLYSADTDIGSALTITGATLATFWAQTQDVLSGNIKNGFSLYEHATTPPIRVPYLTTGVPKTITPPTGYTLTAHYPPGSHMPPSESAVKQTDTYFSDNSPNAWHDSTFVSLGYDEYEAIYNTANGYDNLWVQYFPSKDYYDGIQFPLDRGWTEAELNRLIAFFGGTTVVILRDEEGNALYDVDGNVLYAKP